MLKNPKPLRSKQSRLSLSLARQNTNLQQVLVGYPTQRGILLDIQEESLFGNLFKITPFSSQPGSLISDFHVNFPGLARRCFLAKEFLVFLNKTTSQPIFQKGVLIEMYILLGLGVRRLVLSGALFLVF